MDINSLLVWQKFNCYRFEESTHTYYYNNVKVAFSVTQFVKRFFEEFDAKTISAKYAKKHNLDQQEVLAQWQRSGLISSLAGTIIHSYLENCKRGKLFEIDYSDAKEKGVFEEVKERVEKILPQAEAFHQDTLNKLFPIQLEYTVGIENVIAGNIDMLCWNAHAQEFQIWDYKNLKEFTTESYYGKKGKSAFRRFDDCHLVEYSVQLNMYKAILQRQLGIQIGKCYLVHFDYLWGKPFEIHQCLDLQKECNAELDKLIQEVQSQ